MNDGGAVHQVLVVGASFGGQCAAARLREAGVEDVVVLENAAEVVDQRFDDETHTWTAHTAADGTIVARVVIRASWPVHELDRSASSIGRLESAVYRMIPGPRRRSAVETRNRIVVSGKSYPAYRGVAAHGVPNYFVLEGPDIGVGNRSVRYLIDAQARYVAALVAETAARECTRIEVKRHIQEQYDRLLEWNSRGTASSWRRTRKPVTSDYEFTRVDAHEENDDYRGPARLIGADGETIDVQVHILATYEPTENRVRWFGRVAPADELPGLHTRANQPVLLQIADNDPVKGVLVDADPWGGSRIVGHGAYPYPPKLDMEIEELFSWTEATDRGEQRA